MFCLKDRSNFLYLSVVLVALILLSSCNISVNLPASTPTEAATVTVVPLEPTQIPPQNADPGAISVTLDTSSVAQSFSSQVVEAATPGEVLPWWGVMPQYTQLTLEGYPITDHLLKAQIFVFPVDGLSVNETAGGVEKSLQALLQSQQVGDSMPYLPLYNAAQVIHSQVEYLDFKNGKGVRYLTQFDQGILPINNHELHYTFQGLTSDGKYYVAAVLPVNLPGLPANESVDLNNPPANFMEDFPKYLTETVDMLDAQPGNAFTPDISALDAMIESLEIR